MSIFVFDEKVNLVIIWGQETTIKSFIKICLFFFSEFSRKFELWKKTNEHTMQLWKNYFFWHARKISEKFSAPEGNLYGTIIMIKKQTRTQCNYERFFFLKGREIYEKFPSSKNDMFFGIYAFFLPWYKHPKHQNSGGKFEKNYYSKFIKHFL